MRTAQQPKTPLEAGPRGRILAGRPPGETAPTSDGRPHPANRPRPAYPPGPWRCTQPWAAPAPPRREERCRTRPPAPPDRCCNRPRPPLHNAHRNAACPRRSTNPAPPESDRQSGCNTGKRDHPPPSCPAWPPDRANGLPGPARFPARPRRTKQKSGKSPPGNNRPPHASAKRPPWAPTISPRPDRPAPGSQAPAIRQGARQQPRPPAQLAAIRQRKPTGHQPERALVETQPRVGLAGKVGSAWFCLKA